MNLLGVWPHTTSFGNIGNHSKNLGKFTSPDFMLLVIQLIKSKETQAATKARLSQEAKQEQVS